MSKWVEHVALFVVFYVNHAISLQQAEFATETYHKTENMARQIMRNCEIISGG
jgi:hypothetical protein